jgi:Putative serine esterase (DUF676)
MRSVIFCTWMALLCFVSSSIAHAEFQFIQRGTSDKLVIFVHGLWGDPIESFKADGANLSWPELMATDLSPVGRESLSAFGIGALGFPASSGDTLSTPEIVTRLESDLKDAKVFDNYRYIFFVSHSLGGIVVKRMLLSSSLAGGPLANKTAAVFLIATPSQGAPAANLVKSLPAALLPFSHRLVLDLTTIDANSFLQTLSNDWANFMRAHPDRYRVYCAYETQPYLTLHVVPLQYSDHNCTENPLPENANHFTIVKPPNVEHSIYIWVRNRIDEYFQGPDPPPPPPPPGDDWRLLTIRGSMLGKSQTLFDVTIEKRLMPVAGCYHLIVKDDAGNRFYQGTDALQIGRRSHRRRIQIGAQSQYPLSLSIVRFTDSECKTIADNLRRGNTNLELMEITGEESSAPCVILLPTVKSLNCNK